MTAVAAGRVIAIPVGRVTEILDVVTAEGGAGLATVTAADLATVAEDTRVDETRAAEAATGTDMAATAIDHVRDAMREATTMSRLIGTTTAKLQDAAAEAQMVHHMIHTRANMMTTDVMITDNLLDCFAARHYAADGVVWRCGIC